MPTFALIAEGITDQVALDAILEGYYRDRTDDGIDVNPLQPRRDETDRTRVAEDTFGGWELVLEFCADHARIAEALVLNDYLIIQIDTDCGDHPRYGVNLTVDGQDKSVGELVGAVRLKLIETLGAPLYERNRDRIFFAICVHSLECWLLPIHETQDGKRKKTKSCETHLQVTLCRSGLPYQKDYDTYSSLSRDYRKRDFVTRHLRYNESFEIFILSLPDLTPANE